MDVAAVDLNLLVVFDALMAERSVTRAGARIGRSQPAMSAALARLRRLLDDELFVRSATGLQPTPRALDLAPPLLGALAQIQATLDATRAFDPARTTQAFTIGLADHPAFVLLPGLLARLRRAAPDAKLHVRGFSHRDHTLLESGETQVAIGIAPTPSANILVAPLFEEHFVCIVRKKHPLARRFSLERFLAFPHLLVSPEGDRRGLVDARLAERGLRRNVVVTLPQMYAAPALVASSDLVATLPAGVVRASGHAALLHTFAPPVPIDPVTFVMAWHRRNDAHPAQVWLREQIAIAGRAA